MDPRPFFRYARERYRIHLRRQWGVPRCEWTADSILQQYRFCNIFREDDRTTEWFRTHVRDPFRESPEVLLATVLFRWFNRISTGEAIFLQKGISVFEDKPCVVATAWDLRHGAKAKWFCGHLRATIRQYCGKGPYVTGSYIIKTPDGMDKLNGVLWCLEQFMLRDDLKFNIADGGSWLENAQAMLDLRDSTRPVSLELVWKWLCSFLYLGDFMAYEVVTDLRHTALLNKAPDIMTWANPGPGAMRGLNRLHGRDLKFRQPKARFIQEMQDLLTLSQDRLEHWPSDWPSWEMREVEHTLCEFDKYERARLGEGRPRQVFR